LFFTSKNAVVLPMAADKLGAPVNDMESDDGKNSGLGLRLNTILSWVKHTAVSDPGAVNMLTLGMPFTRNSVVSAALHPVAVSAYTKL
jgi:hypothetical protein